MFPKRAHRGAYLASADTTTTDERPSSFDTQSFEEVLNTMDRVKYSKSKENYKYLLEAEGFLENLDDLKSDESSQNQPSAYLDLGIDRVVNYVDAMYNKDYYTNYYIIWVTLEREYLESILLEYQQASEEKDVDDSAENHLWEDFHHRISIEEPTHIESNEACISYWVRISGDYSNVEIKFRDIEYSNGTTDEEYVNFEKLLSGLNAALYNKIID